jgi:hypothetical protein
MSCQDGDGTAAQFYHPTRVAADKDVNVLVADPYNNRFRKIAPHLVGDVSTLAGTGLWRRRALISAPRAYDKARAPGDWLCYAINISQKPPCFFHMHVSVVAMQQLRRCSISQNGHQLGALLNVLQEHVPNILHIS